MSHRKRRETKQQLSMLLGPAVPGCCLVSFHFLCDIHSLHSVPVGQPGQVLDVLPEGHVLLGIHIFEGGVIGAEEERDGGGTVGVRDDVHKDIVNDQLHGE